MAWRPGSAVTWAGLTLLTLIAVLLARGLIEAILGPAGILPASTRTGRPDLRDVTLAVIVAPLLEETLSRGWLSGRRAALRFALYGAAALGLMLAALASPPDVRRMIAVAAVVTVFAGLIQWSITRHRERERSVPGWFIRHFRWLAWGSSLAFALLHLGNYEALTHPLGVVVVMPLMLGGMLLAYTRTRLGLRAAIAQHAAYNAVLVGAALALM
jgi:membrane protease YdiL (CAAX protease family)